MIEATFIIPLLIVAVTQMIKMILPTVQGWVTIIVALIIGVVIALTDTYIGVVDITVAQGIVLALGAIGVSVLAKKSASGV